MMANAKTVAEVGYLLVDVLRFWHSAVDCASFGLLSEVSLLVSVLAPFWLLASLHWWWRWSVILKIVYKKYMVISLFYVPHLHHKKSIHKI